MTPQGMNYAAQLDCAMDVAKAMLHLHCNNVSRVIKEICKSVVNQLVRFRYRALLLFLPSTKAKSQCAGRCLCCKRRFPRFNSLRIHSDRPYHFLDTLRTLRSLHMLVLHLDLKTHNILLASSAEGKGVTCKVGTEGIPVAYTSAIRCAGTSGLGHHCLAVFQTPKLPDLLLQIILCYQEAIGAPNTLLPSKS
eukprot:1155638-Pelagomonas_calceolata.AAC.3